MIQGLVIESINLPERDPAPHLINKKDALPPIRKRNSDSRNKSMTSSHSSHVDDEQQTIDKDGNARWTKNCKCTRCKLMKNDYEVGINDRYDHWGQYPCVPDSVINRDEEDSSVDSGEVREKSPDK